MNNIVILDNINILNSNYSNYFNGSFSVLFASKDFSIYNQKKIKKTIDYFLDLDIVWIYFVWDWATELEKQSDYQIVFLNISNNIERSIVTVSEENIEELSHWVNLLRRGSENILIISDLDLAIVSITE